MVFVKIIRRIIVFVIVLVVLAAGSLWLILHKPDFLVKTLRYVVEQKAPAVELRDLTIKRCGFLKNWKYLLNGVTAEVVIKDSPGIYIISIDWIMVENLPEALTKAGRFLVTAVGIRFQDLERQIDALGFTFQAKASLSDFKKWNGGFKGSLLKWQDYKITNIVAHFKTQADTFTLEDFEADAYGGNLSAKFLLEYAKPMAYHMDVELRELDVARLKEAQPAFENVRGKISGPLTVDGNLNGMTGLTGSLKAVSGGQIKASLLQPILQYVPTTQQKLQLEKVISQGGLVPLQTAEVQLKSVEAQKLTTQFNLKSKEYNLDLNLTLDFNVEGGLMRLLEVQKEMLE